MCDMSQLACNRTRNHRRNTVNATVTVLLKPPALVAAGDSVAITNVVRAAIAMAGAARVARVVGRTGRLSVLS
jgi:hypothetical protein